jgi:class 3 adenylate cyclase
MAVEPRPEADPVHAASDALAKGNLLLAYDVATTALDKGATHPRLRYLQVLSLARMGEVGRASTLYDRHLRGDTDDLDTMALRARLMKDAAWRAGDSAQAELLSEASAAYETIFARTHNAFPAVNAASLAFLAGQEARSARLAREALTALGDGPPGDYYAAATAAEAQLVLGNEAEAEDAIELALLLPGCDQGARSSTSRQLTRIVEASGRGADIVARLRPPPVIVFCGHMLIEDDATEARLTAEINAVLDETGATIVYGALACGADILIAEAVLARGGELNVVLPFLIPDFVKTSVEPGGPGWLERFEQCMARAADIVIASETHALGDERQYKYASLLMMGYARLRGIHLDTRALQLAVWDEKPVPGDAGTGADVRLWHDHGGELRLIPFDRSALPRPRAGRVDTVVKTERAVRGMMFADFAGFSKIDEAKLPDFWETVLTRVAAVVDRYDAEVSSRNTWGDALYVVTTSATAAANLALDLQREMAQTHFASFGGGAGMRISAHLGSVYQAVDPVTGKTTFFGREVNRTARIEPIASVGEVYVTRAFGAVLSMESPTRFDLAYVGRVLLAKKSGEEPMYRLTRAD